MRDSFGRVFFRENKVYRAIFEGASESCERLLSSALFKELVSRGWVPETRVSTLHVQGFPLVLEHEKLMEIAQHEWSFSMLKDAAIRVWHINKLCNTYGYELKDGHTLNILFRGTEPVWSDVGSIAPVKNKASWIAYDEYLSSFVLPLICWSKGAGYIARKLLESHFYEVVTLPSQRITDSGIPEIIKGFPLRYYFSIKRKKLFYVRSANAFLAGLIKPANKIASILLRRPSSFFSFDLDRSSISALSPFFEVDQFENNLQGLSSPDQSSTWNAYHTQYYSAGKEISFSPRFQTLAALVSATPDIKTVIDLAGNEGFFCLLLSENKKLERIILTDYDSNAVDSGYNRFKTLKDPRVCTALLNFMFTPNQEETQQRLRSDLAIALAVTHHLLLGNGFSIQTIFERLSGFSGKYVLTEFMPLGLWAKGEEVKQLPAWYTKDWFRSNFEKYFEILEERQTEDNRIYFFGKKKDNS